MWQTNMSSSTAERKVRLFMYFVCKKYAVAQRKAPSDRQAISANKKQQVQAAAAVPKLAATYQFETGSRTCSTLFHRRCCT